MGYTGQDVTALPRNMILASEITPIDGKIIFPEGARKIVALSAGNIVVRFIDGTVDRTFAVAANESLEPAFYSHIVVAGTTVTPLSNIRCYV